MTEEATTNGFQSIKRPNYYLKPYFLWLQYSSAFIVIYMLNIIRFYES